MIVDLVSCISRIVIHENNLNIPRWCLRCGKSLQHTLPLLYTIKLLHNQITFIGYSSRLFLFKSNQNTNRKHCRGNKLIECQLVLFYPIKWLMTTSSSRLLFYKVYQLAFDCINNVFLLRK